MIPVTPAIPSSPVSLRPIPDLTPGPGRQPLDTGRAGLPCGARLSAEARPAAMVALSITDPCRPDTNLILSHGGLSITVTTDPMGAAEIVMPAFADPAAFTVQIGQGDPLVASVAVPDIADFHRVAIQWSGPEDLRLRASERGARPGERGHIWRENPGAMADAVLGLGGFHTAIGTGQARAEIYTFPADALGGAGLVRFSVDVTTPYAACGDVARARLLQAGPDAPGASSVDLAFALPDCGAPLLVLQNVFRDLRIAAD
ncbi:MAG: hypothetical protein AAF914_06240 [Pseudomonadota bacterium]